MFHPHIFHSALNRVATIVEYQVQMVIAVVTT
jgi:hypothetical protein